MSATMFATAGSSIKLWDAQNYTQYQEIPPVNGRVAGITWTQNGQCIASLGETLPEVSLYAVNSKSTANIGVVRGVDSPSCLQFPCRSSHYLGFGSKDGVVVLWSLKSKSRKKAFTVNDSPISRIAFSHNDSHIAAASKGSVYLLSTVNNSVRGPHKIFENQAVTEVVYSMVKKSLLGCCSDGGSVSLFDAHASKIIHAFNNAHASPVSSVSFSPINELLMISVGYDKKFACYSIQTKKQILTHKSSAPLTSAAFLPGCQHIALGAMTGEVFIHDLRTLRKPLVKLEAHDAAVTSILLQPSTKHISDGTSSDSKPTDTKPRKKSEASSTKPSKSSSETPTQEVPVELAINNKSEASSVPAVDPSQDVLSVIFSPVRPSEQITNGDDAIGDEKVLNYDMIMDNVLSPVRSGGHILKEHFSSPSENLVTNLMFEDVFSPVRTSENADPPGNFHDVSSPVMKGEVHLSPGPVQKAKSFSKTTVDVVENVPDCDISQDFSQKENVDPNKTATPIACRIECVGSVKSMNVENILSKNIPSPVHHEDSKHASNASSSKAVLNNGIEIMESSSPLDYKKLRASSLLSSNFVSEDTPTALKSEDKSNSSKEKDDTAEVVEGTTSTIGASHLQVELIRNCMAEVLEEFQDNVNRRMMHLQFVVTKQFLQLQETVQQLQQQQSLNDDLLLENERLREENKYLKANF